jgi:hypothetical protein
MSQAKKPIPEASRPRDNTADQFEQNPLSAIHGRLSDQALSEFSDEARVRETLRRVITEGKSLTETARDLRVAPSFVALWREKYREVAARDTQRPVANAPLISEAGLVDGADLNSIPEIAREQFSSNWERLMEQTLAREAAFQQDPWRVTIETSPATGWLFREGRVDRVVAWGASIALVASVIAVSYFSAARAYVPTDNVGPPAEREDVIIESAANVARSFFQATSLDEKKKFLHLTPVVDGLVDEYFSRQPMQEMADAEIRSAFADRAVVSLEFDVPSKSRSHFCNVVKRSGRWLIDWETTSFFQEDHLQRIIAARPTEPTRVTAQLSHDDYYSYDYTDVKKWKCYRLSYPGLVLNLFAYVRVDSSEQFVLDSLLSLMPHQMEGQANPQSLPKHKEPVVLEIRYGPKARRGNQAEIIRVIHEKWVAE